MEIEHWGRGRVRISGGSWRTRAVAGIIGLAILGGLLVLALTGPSPADAVEALLLLMAINAMFIAANALQYRRQRRRRAAAAGVNSRSSDESQTEGH